MLGGLVMSIKYKLGIIIGVFVALLVAAIGVTFWNVNSQKNDSVVINMAGRQRMLSQKFTKEFFNEVIPSQVRASAVKAAQIATIQIKEDRAKYTTGIIGKLKRELPGFKPARDWSSLKGGVPLPATFVQEVSETINKTGVYRYDLLSRWNINSDKGLSDKFENDAFDFLIQQKNQPYFRFMEYDSKFVLRYATADIAGSKACVSCHNAHPSSAKKDFKLGDVMGTLVVTIPITDDVAIGNTIFGGGVGGSSGEGLHSYEGTAKVFTATMDALISGGQAPLDLKMTSFVTLSKTDDQQIAAQLKKVAGLWKNMMEHIKIINTAKVNSTEYLTEFVKVQQLNLDVTAEMSTAVTMYEAVSKQKVANMKMMLVAFLIVAIIAGIIGWFMVIRFVVRPVHKVVTMAETLANGDLSVANVEIKTRDEMYTLAEALNKVKASFNGVLGKLRNSSDEIADATAQLATTSSQIVEGTQKQSSQSAQAATAMEEMSATVVEVAKNSQNAADSASETQEIAVSGGDVVKKAVQGMMNVADTVKESATTVEALGKSSDEIGAIISVINDIADQTNLLALNAAIEAARAGEQGRGFAVVADEVRKLAEKTTKATKEIADMIKTIQNDTKGAMSSMHEGTKQVEEGVQLASEAGESLQQIVSSVDRVTDMVRQIATAAEEQSATSEEISSNIGGIAEVANENSEGVRHVSEAADNLERIANELKAIVGTFTLEAGNASFDSASHSVDEGHADGDVDGEDDSSLKVV
jgi:methyl-accepting chemotaxis protein